MLARTHHDRAGLNRRDDTLIPTVLARPDTRVLDLFGSRFMLSGHPARLALRAPRPGDEDHLVLYLGQVERRHAVAVLHPREHAPADSCSLRSAGMMLDDTQASLVVAAIGLANWHAATGFCPHCGSPTDPVQGGWVRRCRTEGREHYPRTDPAVIMAVLDDDDRLLLARNQRYRTQLAMSVLAGFVEPGESLEAAVRREVMEEVGLAVRDVQYVANQPWPFPASLMVGFTARTTAGPLQVDPVELDRARWFTRPELIDALRAGELTVPPSISIARHLIEGWYGGPLPQTTS